MEHFCNFLLFFFSFYPPFSLSFWRTHAHVCTRTRQTHTHAQSGLAGALSNVRLGERRSSAQDRIEETLRRQYWESGNADYTGRDAFKHILAKIEETMDKWLFAPAYNDFITI